MALTPAQLAELQRLRQMFVPLAEQAKRDAQRQDNLDKMNPQNKAGGGSMKDLEGHILKHEGKYGADRFQRAMDEIPGLEHMYSEDALRRAFTGDNAHALISMNPAHFEHYANLLTDRKHREPTPSLEDKKAKRKVQKFDMSTEDYLKYLNSVGRFHDVPFLEMHKDETGLPMAPSITGHEGRHRNRALAKAGKTKSLVQIYPKGALREDLPRRYRQEYIDALRNELAMKNNLVYPQHTDDDGRRPAIQLPDIYAEGGQVKNPFDYENANHVDTVAGIASKHKDFSSTPQAAHHLGEMLSTGNWKYIEDPRIQSAIKRAGHDSYYVAEKTGKHSHVINKAGGGGVPSMAQMKLALSNKPTTIDLKNIGVNEAPNMAPKMFFAPDTKEHGIPAPGGVATPSGMPIGGIDMSRMQPGQQLMPLQQGMQQQPPQGAQPPQGGALAPQGPTPPMGNMLQMTPQGQAMSAMSGGAPNMPPQQKMAKGGTAKSVDEMKSEMAAKKSDGDGKRVTIRAEGPGGVKGLVVPRHTLEGNAKSGAVGLHEMNEARAQVYGSEHREPLTIGKIGETHKKTLAEHFKKPVEEQIEAEKAALGRLRQAKHLGKDADTLDESEKLDTVRHEHDEEGRTHVGYASKGVAGHALYTSGAGKDTKYHVINTCPGQTEGCGGGKDAEGIVDTKKGTCFAPNAESQYPGAATRRAAHEQAKHDPAMTNDWILAHTHSLRNAANRADKKNQRTLFRPNVVDETDVSSRHVIRHLNEQRKAEGKPGIIANSYGKTNELHDPENGYHVTHSNVGPKVKKGQEISENIKRDKARVRNTIMAADNKGDFKNEQGNKTPPKGSYMVTDVKRGSPMAKKMEEHITHAKYWSTGRPESELSEEEKAEGPEGHFGGNGKPTSEDKAHYGHRTLDGLRYDYQRQHILHPRLVQVGNNKDGTPHMIPTDSRFKDTEFLPKKRFKTKNGKEAGHILMTTPTESTSNIGHQTSFTHHVSDKHIDHAMANNGEYEIDRPEDQAKAKGKEYRAPQAIKFYAEGGAVGARHVGFGHDEFHAFPEQNIVAQRHLAMRRGEDETQEVNYKAKGGKVAIHKNMDTVRLELTKKAK